jgi:hypothetical protein
MAGIRVGQTDSATLDANAKASATHPQKRSECKPKTGTISLLSPTNLVSFVCRIELRLANSNLRPATRLRAMRLHVSVIFKVHRVVPVVTEVV